MNASFYNGISGIKTENYGINIVADNIANISTIGFKGSSPEYSSTFSTALSDAYTEATLNDIGLGSRASSTTLNMSQGVFQFTDNVFDLALGGEGWFGVSGIDNQTYYTRAGSFSLDSEGNMVDPNGNYLLGTLGGNIVPTSLSQEVLDEFGLYYGVNSQELGSPYAVSDLFDITLGSVDAQEKINLPDILYYPPVATTNVSYQANLDPQINISSTDVDLNNADIISSIDLVNNTIDINGTITNTPEILNAQVGDAVLITITDINGIQATTSALLDSNFNWIMPTKDISLLDTTNAITVSAALQTTQEIPNVEHFSSTIISPNGENDVLDMTYTKRVPQPALGSVWDGVIQVLSFYEKYNPDLTYDPLVYKVDKTAEKVYEIIDSQTATIEFGGSGELLSSTMPTMSNSGTPLSIDIGEENSFTGLVSNINLDKTKSEQHDGYLSGMLKAYGMDGNGNVIAEFDNGKSIALAKVAVYHFQNDQGLEKINSNLFAASSNSGNAIFYTDANGNSISGTQIFANRLEGSNVSMATALTELIIMQKSFDSNAKSITTSDEMIQNAINMKR